jgi:hypothetical protein
VGILQTAAHVGLDALHARLLVTLVALDLFPYHGGIGVGADGAGCVFYDLVLGLCVVGFGALPGFLGVFDNGCNGLWLYNLPLQS